MEKSFLCPKCRSINVRVQLSDGTLLKSLGNKLEVEARGPSARPGDSLRFENAKTRSLDCKFEFLPKYLDQGDVVHG